MNTRGSAESTDASDADRAALLYDWHNEHRLRDQQCDIPYWISHTADSRRTLVLGAGTGRVAVPLARHGRGSVVAFDLDAARLRRLPAPANLRVVCGDMRHLPLAGRFDAVVVPYSTMQLLLHPADRRRAAREAARVLSPGSYLHIDVSGSFDTSTPTDWRLVLAQAGPDSGPAVQEWERRRPACDYVLIEKVFRADEVTFARVEERWAYLASLDLDRLLDQTGFEITDIDRGYAPGASTHRLIYHARRRG